MRPYDSTASYVDCGFTVKQVPPSEKAIAANDTDHWYIMVEPEGADQTPIANAVTSIILKDDSSANASRIARMLDEAVQGLNFTVLTRAEVREN
jgi:hypothetical protein